MFKMLRPKVLLFFAVSMMSFYITSEKSYAADTPMHSSTQSYVDGAKKTVVSAGFYCQHLFNQMVDYLHDLFQPRATIHGAATHGAATHGATAPAVTSDDVKIQIMGHHAPIVDDADEDETGGDEDDNKQDDACMPGDVMCEKNLNFFNKTYFEGMLALNDQNPSDIDARDKEYKRMTEQQLKLLYGQDASHTTQEFDYGQHTSSAA